MVVTIRPRFDSLLDLVIRSWFLKKIPSLMKSMFGGFVGPEKVPFFNKNMWRGITPTGPSLSTHSLRRTESFS
jgi:hypothetical protein